MNECRGVALQHAADSLQLHTNSCHRAHLRSLAGWVSGQQPESIVSAELVFLCRHGFQISWLDLTGSHVLPICFVPPADNSDDLATLLGAYLHP